MEEATTEEGEGGEEGTIIEVVGVGATIITTMAGGDIIIIPILDLAGVPDGGGGGVPMDTLATIGESNSLLLTTLFILFRLLVSSLFHLLFI